MKSLDALILSVCICCAVHGAIAAPPDAPVRIRDGLVTGIAADGTQVFKGIPFAAPPVGNLRWRAPKPVKPWGGVLKADHFAPACAQNSRAGLRSSAAASSEDCLYLNIWSSASSSAGAKLPVLVWIHGGGFLAGSASDPRFDGAQLAHKGVVVVTIAYRVGPLGFLVHPELAKESVHRTSGNYGILDQIAALSWIRANIAAFGGDPKRVTIFGQSAGSTSVNILQAAPLAKDLFRRVVGESTSQMDSAAGLPGLQSRTQAERAGLAYQAAMGAHSLAELRALPADRLTDTSMHFWPLEGDGYVLPMSVYAAFAAGKINPADVLVGANAEEGEVLRQHWIQPVADTESVDFLKLYGSEPGPARQSDTDTVLWQMWSWADLNQRVAHSASYLYWFTKTPPAFLAQPDRPVGPIHGAEIPYVFDNLSPHDAAWTDSDRRVAEAMSTYWTNFAKTGNPNGNGLPDWPRYQAHDPRVMEFGSDMQATAMPRAREVEFIDSYFRARRQRFRENGPHQISEHSQTIYTIEYNTLAASY